MNLAQKIAAVILILAMAGIFALANVLGYLLVRDEIHRVDDRVAWTLILAIVGLSVAIVGLATWRWTVGGRIVDRERLTTIATVATATGIIIVAWALLYGFVQPDNPAERTSVAQIAIAIVGGTVLGMGGYVGWQSLQVARVRTAQERQNAIDRLEHDEKRLDLDRIVALTENFTAAVEQLGATHGTADEPNLEVRLGAIYALERISKNWFERDADDEYWAVIEVLTAYVRRNQGPEIDIQGRPREDIDAILDVLEKRSSKNKEAESELRRMPNLRGCDFRGTALVRRGPTTRELCHLEFQRCCPFRDASAECGPS